MSGVYGFQGTSEHCRTRRVSPVASLIDIHLTAGDWRLSVSHFFEWPSRAELRCSSQWLTFESRGQGFRILTFSQNPSSGSAALSVSVSAFEFPSQTRVTRGTELALSQLSTAAEFQHNQPGLISIPVPQHFYGDKTSILRIETAGNKTRWFYFV